MVTVLLNGESRQFEREVDLETLIDLFSLPDKRIAIELNGEVIRRADWCETIVKDGDRLEVVHFVGGG